MCLFFSEYISRQYTEVYIKAAIRICLVNGHIKLKNVSDTVKIFKNYCQMPVLPMTS